MQTARMASISIFVIEFVKCFGDLLKKGFHEKKAQNLLQKSDRTYLIMYSNVNNTFRLIQFLIPFFLFSKYYRYSVKSIIKNGIRHTSMRWKSNVFLFMMFFVVEFKA